MTHRDEATQRQINAAQPDRSTWLAANAGSGKTRVLTDRVARLLLDGVSPEHILCLTYTKAAASEMQNRLFRRLGDWAMKEDAPLRETLQELGIEGAISSDTLRRARRLFASAIETPGGLKIQTIHSFCSSILRRFPLEAGVSPQFREMEDRAATLMRAEIVDDMADGEESDIIARLASQLTDPDFDAITAEVARNRIQIDRPLPQPELLSLFGLPEDASEEWLLSRVFLGNEAEMLSTLVTGLAGGGKTDQRIASSLRGLPVPDLASLPKLESAFLFGAKAKAGAYAAKIGSFPTKALREGALASLMPQLEDFMRRVEEARNLRLSIEAVAKTRALHDFAAAFLPRYEHAKLVRGALDFDDLILKTLELLTDRRVAEWVLFRLDGGIDHILVDEAQDTSPVQWQVIEKLAREFTSGEGARTDVARTIFVVGDKKQSIYSFQGADPREFDRMKAEFAQRLKDADTPLQDTTLQFSFRSAEAILRLVDTVFETREPSGFSKEETHRAFKSDMGGRVDLWPMIEKGADTPSDSWDEPVDLISDTHHDVQLAERIAGEIRRMLDEQVTIPTEKTDDGWIGRTVTAGDFLILVRRRSDLFAEIIRACKAAKLPIAGADRLKVGAEIAVRDLGALLSWLATPEDDLSLAVVLKSPLVGWSEQQLFNLAHGREQKYLWRELADRQGEFPDLWQMLTDLRDNADFLRPYDLIERALTRHEGRRRLLARLGTEAEDGINALLSQALSYEQSEIPSLTGFLIWMESDELEIKRQMDSASDRIRVMTVHGAKGLEAPIVILPDTAAPREQVRDALVPIDGHIVWKTRSEDSPEAMVDAIAALKDKQREERDRLLYVAMTRAESWLIVAGAGDGHDNPQSWYHAVNAAMKHVNGVLQSFSFGEGKRVESGVWPTEIGAVPDTTVKDSAGIPPSWATSAALAPIEPAPTLSPSDLGGAKALPGPEGQDEESAMRYGTLVHAALEALAELPFAEQSERPEGNEADKAFNEALRTLTAPESAFLFENGTLGEVAVSAELDDGRRLHGIVDRLIIRDAEVLVVDFKTNASVPDTSEQVPEGILRQMGAYSAMLSKVYPDHRIKTAILWTRTTTFMQLPHDLVTDAFARTTSP